MATRTPTETPSLPEEVTKVGNITDDPALAFAKESGKPFARFSMAVDRPKVKGDWAGERETTFYRVTCFDGLASNVCESLEKGCRVVVSGRPEVDEWVDRNGNARKDLRILANAVGPDLRFATVKVTRVPKHQPATPTAVDGGEEPF
jgi:single-strand DNA-binding protein